MADTRDACKEVSAAQILEDKSNAETYQKSIANDTQHDEVVEGKFIKARDFLLSLFDETFSPGRFDGDLSQQVANNIYEMFSDDVIIQGERPVPTDQLCSNIAVQFNPAAVIINKVTGAGVDCWPSGTIRTYKFNRQKQRKKIQNAINERNEEWIHGGYYNKGPINIHWHYEESKAFEDSMDTENKTNLENIFGKGNFKRQCTAQITGNKCIYTQPRVADRILQCCHTALNASGAHIDFKNIKQGCEQIVKTTKTGPNYRNGNTVPNYGNNGNTVPNYGNNGNTVPNYGNYGNGNTVPSDNNNVIILIVCVITFLIILGSCYYYYNSNDEMQVEDGLPPLPPPSVVPGHAS